MNGGQRGRVGCGNTVIIERGGGGWVMKSHSGGEKYAVSNKGKQKDQRRRAHYTAITPGSPENSVTTVRTQSFSLLRSTRLTQSFVSLEIHVQRAFG